MSCLPYTNDMGKQSLAAILFRTLPADGLGHLGIRRISGCRQPADRWTWTGFREQSGNRTRPRSI